MLRQLIPLLLATLICCAGTACKKKPKDNLEERKKMFQAQQRKKAVENYQELVTKYPESKFAAQAQERLRTLGPPPPTPKKK